MNGGWKQSKGYCTDFWFGEAIRYIEQPRDKPFFLSIHTNAPHDPYIVPDSYAEPYRKAGLSDTLAIFYGMITCIDENIGRFRTRLKELGLAENTLLVFMTDNGTSAGWITLHRWAPYLEKPMGMVEALLRTGDHVETMPLKESDAGAPFRLKLTPGPAMLKTWLKRPGPERLEHGAYYVQVRYLNP